MATDRSSSLPPSSTWPPHAAELSEAERRGIEAVLAHRDDPRSASVEALKVVQQHRGWVSDEALRAVADALGMTGEELDSVATFYNLIYRRPVGRHVIHLCDSVSCWLTGYEAVRKALYRRLGIKMGETTPDGRFTLLPIVCLGDCDRAPAMLIDGRLHNDLEAGAIGRILEGYP